MVSWDKIYRPKKANGLRLRKMQAANSSILSKLTWKLSNEQRVWVEQMIANYQINKKKNSILNPKFD